MKSKKNVKQAQNFFKTLDDKFQPQHNETIFSLQYFLINQGTNENAKKGISLLRIKENKYGYKEKDRRLKQQIFKNIYDETWGSQRINRDKFKSDR